MRGTVVVQVLWADPGRAGLRTLHVGDSSIDEVLRVVERAVSRTGDRAAVRWTASQGLRAGGDGDPSPPLNGAKRKRALRTATGKAPPDGHAEHHVPASGATRAADTEGEGHAPEPPVDHPPPEPAAGLAPILWASHAPEGRFGPAATLVRVQIEERKVLLRIPGIHDFDVGRAVRLDGIDPAGRFFAAEMMNGSEHPIALRVAERLL